MHTEGTFVVVFGENFSFTAGVDGVGYLYATDIPKKILLKLLLMKEWDLVPT